MKLIKEITKIKKEPLVVIDIGARNGILPSWEVVKNKYPLRVVGFEPEEKECEILNKKSVPSVKYLSYALSSKETENKFYITKSRSNCALFEPDHNYINRFVPHKDYKVEEVKKIHTVCLDSILNHYQISDIDFMKIDAEGSELEIL